MTITENVVHIATRSDWFFYLVSQCKDPEKEKLKQEQ